MRLLDKSKLQLDMTQLGFEQEPLRRFKDAIDRPYGIVLVTGRPAPARRTRSTRRSRPLNDPTVNIMTAEDPIEFNLAGINQVQMKEQIGLTFASALRSFLRQDPDIILVGEIRDFETAEIAVKAALTGHLVLSTLHTNDAPSTINRLMNMGIEPFLVATSVNCDLRAAARAPHLHAVHRRSRDAAPDAHAGRASLPTRSSRCKIKRGPRLRALQQHRLQGTRRPLRGPRLHRRDPRHDPVGRVVDRVEAQGDRGGHGQPAACPGSRRSRKAPRPSKKCFGKLSFRTGDGDRRRPTLSISPFVSRPVDRSTDPLPVRFQA